MLLSAMIGLAGLMVMDILCSCADPAARTPAMRRSDYPSFMVPGRLGSEALVQCYEGMDASQRVGQLLLVHLRWAGKGESGLELDGAQRAELRRLQPGGVVLYAQNLGTVEQTIALIGDIRQQCRIVPFIAIDEEGGRVSRLYTSRGIRATRVPAAAELARGGQPAVSEAYRIMGSELRALGFNLDFAPVADLGYPESSAIIGDRAFGQDPATVAALVGAAVDGLQGAGVCAVIKHFPGHGRANGDTHLGRQVIQADWQTLVPNDLEPFREAIARRAGAMMTAHVVYPAIDPSAVPASLSRTLLVDKLRLEMGFDGLIVTDALDMQGVMSTGTTDSVALKSLAAGVDMLLSPENPQTLKNHLEASLETGGLDPKRLEESCRRILAVKNRFGILGQAAAWPAVMARTVVGSAEHLRTMRELLALRN